MKLLILGIDGGDIEIIRRLDMPFLQGLLASSETRQLEEDLISRGWAEILTGKHASQTRALYMRPMLDGTYRFTTRFNADDMTGNPDVTPLWDMTPSSEHRVGFMNVPTTGPAPSVNGFLVAGGGGGVDKVDEIPESLIHPPAVRDILRSNNYEVDLRLTSSGVKSFTELVKRLNGMVEKRAATYCHLAREFKPTLGFPCFRVSTVLQYLAMCELQALFATQDMPEFSNQHAGGCSEIQQLLLSHFRVLDEAIEKVFSVIEPQSYIVVSDHGCVPYLYHANAESLLLEHGYQQPPSGVRSTAGLIVKSYLSRFVPTRTRMQLLRSSSTIAKAAPLRFHSKKSLAFSNYYMQGVYINDSMRFGGPVKGERAVCALVEEICDAINGDPTSKEHEMQARPYRSRFEGDKFEQYLPDIHIEKPDSMFFTNAGAYVSRNERYGPLSDDISTATDMHTGQKGRYPLYYFSPDLAELDPTDVGNLTAVYQLAKRFLSS